MYKFILYEIISLKMEEMCLKCFKNVGFKEIQQRSVISELEKINKMYKFSTRVVKRAPYF